jgi:hypothetical protein
LLGKMVWSSLRWLQTMCSMCVWKLSVVFRCAPFFWCSNTCMMSLMGPKGCGLYRFSFLPYHVVAHII